MSLINPRSTLVQPVDSVKSINSQLPLFPPEPVIHHKVQGPYIVGYTIREIQYGGKPYGVSRSHRVLSPGLLLKKYDRVRDCLAGPMGLTVCQREVVIRLLRLWAYYGSVYPKESQVTELPGCSKATFWRTIRELKELGLVHVINRYVIRPHAQISNLYRLNRLVLVIARYLAEHGTGFLEPWLKPYLQLPGRVFWGSLAACRQSRAGPYGSGPPSCSAW
ncbi:hypothetical protein ES708_02592 [subsurface metagenome]